MNQTNQTDQIDETVDQVVQISENDILTKTIEQQNKMKLANIKQQLDSLEQLVQNIKQSNQTDQANQTDQTDQTETIKTADVQQQLDEIKKRLDTMNEIQNNIIHKMQNYIVQTTQRLDSMHKTQNNIINKMQTSDNTIQLNNKFLKINMNTTINVDSIIKIEKYAGFIKIYTNIKKQTLKNDYETYETYGSYYQNMMNLFFPIE